MSRSGPAGYSAAQIGLHWLMAALVLFQLVFGESMGEVHRAVHDGRAPQPLDQFLADAHYWIGLAILALVFLRLGLRLLQGAPEPVDASLTGRLSLAVHWLFYAMLVIVPLTGLATVYVSSSIGEIHELSKPAFIVLIIGHAGAALVHHFWLKDGTLRRMLVPGA